MMMTKLSRSLFLPLIALLLAVGPVLAATPTPTKTAKTPVPTPTPLARGERGDLRDRRKSENWDKDQKAVFGDYEGAAARPYSLEDVRADDAKVKPSNTLAVYTFDTDPTGVVPNDFSTAVTDGQGATLWRVETNYNATTGNQVVAQRDATKADRFTALLLNSTPVATRIDVTTRVWIEDAGREQTAGILVGSPGTAEGYAFLLDTSGNTMNAQRIVAGKGAILPNTDVVREALQGTRKIETGRWYHLRVEFDTSGTGRSEMVGYLDGVKMVEARDNVYLEPGFVGLVTKGSTRALFDTVTITFPKNWDGSVVTATSDSDAPLLSGESSGECATTITQDFNAYDADIPVPGFESVALGEGTGGEWQVRADDKNNPRNVVQISRTEQKDRFNGLILQEDPLSDFEVTARLRTKSGRESSRLAGLVVRYVDSKNYYYAALNTGSREVTITRVANGRHQVIETNKLTMKNNTWYTMKVIADGTNLRVMVDGDTKLRVTDNTFEAGQIGFLTQSNTVAQFDDLVICSYRVP